MNQTPIPDLEKIFRQIPLLADYQLKDLRIKRLPGFTNFNFHIKNPSNDWVLRIPKADTDLYINRAAEISNLAIVSELDFVPQCIWSDSSGLSLSRTLSNTHSLTATDLEDEGIFRSVVLTIKKVHQVKTCFSGTVETEELLIRYFRLLSVSQQKELELEFRKARSVIKKLNQYDQKLVPSHNDLVLENILLGESKIWLIDWEYSSMASPYWDLASLCNAADFNEARMQKLLDIYNNETRLINQQILTDYRYVLKTISSFWMDVFG